MTALPFRPCDYALLWDSETHSIYSMSSKALQEANAGAPEAENCPFFTDNVLQLGFFNRSALRYTNYNGTYVHVVRVNTGVFTGAYTWDEEEEYRFDTSGAKFMWSMTALPLFGWALLIYLFACVRLRLYATPEIDLS